MKDKPVNNPGGIGQPIRRLEDERFLTGQGCYVDDISLANMAYGAVLLSPHAHARINSINTDAARAAPGVLLVLTGADVIADKLGTIVPLFMPEDMGGPKGYRTQRPLLVNDRARYIGDRVAFVVANTQDEARRAVDLIEVDYDPQPAVVDPDKALNADAPRIWDDCPDNTCFTVEFGDREATSKTFAMAKHIVSLDVRMPRLTANAIEPRASLGQYQSAERHYSLWTSSQNPHGVRTALAKIFGINASRLRVISPDVGGAFGMKADMYPEDALVLWASRRAGRPVKWVATRSESLAGDTVGRGQVVHGELALNEVGRILAIRSDSTHSLGPYIVSAAAATVLFGARFIPSVYDVQTIHLMARAVFTNTGTLGPYRGAGRPEAVFLIERLLDKAARVIGISPVEIRKRNFIVPTDMPYKTATSFDYDSGEFEAVLDKCLVLANWHSFEQRRADAMRRGRLRGIGIACFIELAGVFNDRMEIRFDPSGALTIFAGTHSHGQGHATTYAQLVNEWLGIPIERISFVQGDTEKVSFGRGTYAARSSMVGGAALKAACDQVISRGRLMAAALMDVSPENVSFSAGVFQSVADGKNLTLVQVATAFFRPGGLPPGLGVGLDAVGFYSADPANFPNGCHICEVEIDPDTGTVSIEKYSAVDDCGRVINPMICKGQLHGAVAQGLGQALCEELAYDTDSGQLLCGSFMDYAMPRASDLMDMQSEFHEVPCKTNPLGIKGIAEAGAIAAPAAAINAIVNALSPLDIDEMDVPATASTVWQTIASVK